MRVAGVGEVRQGNDPIRTRALNRGKLPSFGVALLILLVFLSGCIGRVTGPSGNNTQPSSLQLSPGNVSFGRVGLGKLATQTISVLNPNQKTITITNISISNPQFTLASVSLPLSVPSGQTTSVSVSVKPTATGNMTGTLSVGVDPANAPVVLNLNATGVNPQQQISLSNPSVDFGSVSVGTQGTQSLAITNVGAADLTVSMLVLTGSEFSVSGIATPKVISSGQTAALTITFVPTAAGSASGSLAITSNDPANPTFNIPLTGSGTNTLMGQLAASPTALSFGNVNTGNNVSKQVVLTNTGNAAVKISQISASGTGFSVSGIAVPATLNASQSATLTVGFVPAATGSALGAITVTSDAKGSPLPIALTGSGVQAGLNVLPGAFNFGSLVEGQTKSQKFSITNSGSASLTIQDLVVSGAGYSVSGLTTPATLAAGQSSTFTAEFAPAAPGSLGGEVTISSNAPNSPAIVPLSGTGVAASLTLTANPGQLAFGSINAGSSSSKNVTVTNSGNTGVTISQVTVSAQDVSTSGITTPIALAPGQAKIVTVSFFPTTAENVTGNVTVTSSQGSSAVVAVSGTGLQAALGLNPLSVAFGSVPVGSANSQTVQLSNPGTGVLTISHVNTSGSGFSTNGITLPLSLNPGATGTFNVQYLPTAAGTVPGSVSIVSDAPSSPNALTLSGTGVAATRTLAFTTTSIGFGSVATAGSVSEGVGITNTGNSDVTISQITPTGAGFGVNGASTPVVLSPMQTLTIAPSFSPTSAGSVNGTVTVTSNATGSPATITLTGTGVQASSHTVALSWNASTSNVTGYNVYRSTTSGAGYLKITTSPLTSLTYVDDTVLSATTYFYVTTAVDENGIESSNSNEATATIP
jgi:hypothetical protein